MNRGKIMSIDINSISLNNQQSNVLDINNNTKDKTTIFEDFYNAAINLYKQTNDFQIASDKAQLDFASGKTDDILDVVITQAKAKTTLQFTAQVTNKVLESYKEILRIQL